MSVQVTFQADDGATLAGLVASFAKAGPTLENFMAAIDTLTAKIQEVSDAVTASKADVLAKIGDEKQQVADAIAALQAQINSLGDVLTADQIAGLTGKLDDLKAVGTSTDVADAVQAIFVPTSAPTPPPA